MRVREATTNGTNRPYRSLIRHSFAPFVVNPLRESLHNCQLSAKIDRRKSGRAMSVLLMFSLSNEGAGCIVPAESVEAEWVRAELPI